MSTVVPSTVGGRRGSTRQPEERIPAYVWLFLAGLAFGMFSGNSQLLGLPVSLDRPLYLLGALLLVLDRRTERLRWRGVYVLMAALVIWTGFSWLDTGYLGETDKAYALADRIVFPFLTFVLGALAFSTPARRDLLLKFVVLLGLYLGVTGIFEFSGVNALVWPRYISDLSLGIQQGRARGPFLASEPDGMVCSLAFYMSAALMARSRGFWRALSVLSLVVSLAVVLLCLTRSVWLAVVLGVVTVGLVAPSLRRWLPVALLGAVAAGGVVLAAVPSLLGKITERATTQLSVYDRLNTNAAALRIIDAEPITGLGWGNFRAAAPDWVRQGATYPISNINIEVHNVFLSRAAETGLVGSALWVAVVLTGPVAAVWAARVSTAEERAWKLIAVGAFFVWLMPSLFSPNPYPLPNLLVWLVAGVAGRRWLLRGGGATAAPAARRA